MNSPVVRFGCLVGIVAAVQWAFSVSFDHDEWERIVSTILLVTGGEAALTKFTGRCKD